MPTPIDVEVGIAYGSAGHAWDTVWITLDDPGDMDEDELGAKAIEEAKKQLAPKTRVARMWVHCIDYRDGEDT